MARILRRKQQINRLKMSFEDEDSLRERQIATLERMLHLNEQGGDADLTLASNKDELIWKVLILDQRSQAIVSSVLRVNDLLRSGITMHSLIDRKRSPLPDVPVIYFVEPTIENIAKIIDDLEQDNYENFYINFTSSVNRDLLEEFAKKVALSGKSSKILQVYDQYLDFIVTEPELFSLDLPNIYSLFNSRSTNEEQINTMTDKIASGLYSLIITTGSIPIIRSQRGGAAELVAASLDQKLRDHVINTRSNQFTGSNNIQRSVLILLDRNIDLSTMFSHSWIYQCLVSDVFSLKRNNITFQEIDKQGNSIKKSYDIDPKDYFWLKNASLPFPDAVENVESELNKYKEEAAELTQRTGITSLNDIDPTANDTSHIQQAVKALPELTARKAIIDMHMTVLAALINQLEAKALDKFFETEQGYNDPKMQSQFLETLSTVTKLDNQEDKLRTFIILSLLTDLPKDFVDKCEMVLKQQDIDLSSLTYIRRVKEITKLSTMTSLSNSTGQQNTNSANVESGALFSGLSSRLYGLAEGRIPEGLGSIVSGMKSLIPSKQQLVITNIVEAIMDPTNAANKTVDLTDDYLYFDPKLTRGVHSKPPKRQSYENSIVFVIGGGNYFEYQNLQEWVSAPNRVSKSVIYGSTDIETPSEFLKECSELGRD